MCIILAAVGFNLWKAALQTNLLLRHHQKTNIYLERKITNFAETNLNVREERTYCV